MIIFIEINEMDVKYGIKSRGSGPNTIDSNRVPKITLLIKASQYQMHNIENYTSTCYNRSKYIGGMVYDEVYQMEELCDGYGIYAGDKYCVYSCLCRLCNKDN